MNKALLIAAISAVILLAAMLMWPTATPRGASKAAPAAGSQPPSVVAKAELYATSEEFYAAWQAYLRGESSDTGRITETASRHPEWIESIFSSKDNDFNDGLQLTMGKFRILYPYLSGAVIDDYGILLTEVSNNKADLITILLKSGANPNKRFILTAASTPSVIDLLVQSGANPNLPLPDGSFPLQYFRRVGRPDMVDALIRNGARVTP